MADSKKSTPKKDSKKIPKTLAKPTIKVQKKVEAAPKILKKSEAKAASFTQSQAKKETPKKARKSYPKGWMGTFFALIFVVFLILFYIFLPKPGLQSKQQNSVSTQGVMELEFNQTMNKKSVESHLSIYPELNGVWVWQSGKKVGFQPSQALELHQNYRVDLGAGAKNWYGKVLRNDFSFGFAVTGPPKVLFFSPYKPGTPPSNDSSQKEIPEQVPESNLPVIDLHQPITVLFDQPMDWKAVDTEQLLLMEPKTEGTYNFFSQRAFEFTPTQWPEKTKIQLKVPKGLPAKNGLKTEQAFEWALQTPGQRIVGVVPHVENAMAVDQALEISFQLPLKLDEIHPGENVQLFPSNDFDAQAQEKRDGFFNTEVAYKKGDPLTLIFKPDPAYQPETDYELIFKAGLAGLEQDFSLKFHTGTQDQLAQSQEPNPIQTQGENPSSLLSLPAGFAPQIHLKATLQAPLNLELCKLPQEVNPLVILPVQPAPCSAALAAVQTFSPAETLALGKLYPQEHWENGLYWLKVSDAKGQVELHPLLLSDTTLIVKRAGDDVLVWALDRLTQEPVARMEVRVYSPDGKELGRGVTDGSGIYKRNQQLTGAIYVMGIKELEGEKRWSLASDQWPLEVGSTSSLISTSPEVYLVTDRNQLQPGESIKFKGFWRTPTQRGYTLPWWGEITLKLVDQNGQTVLSQPFELKEKASFDGEMHLPENLTPGLYQLQGFEVEKPLSTLSTWLKVEQANSTLLLNWVKMPDFNSNKPVAKVQLSDANGLPGVTQGGQWVLYEHNAFNPLHTQELLSGMFEFDANGEGKFEIEWGGESPLKSNTTYSLEVQATDEALPVNLAYTFNYEPRQYPVEIRLDAAILEQNSPLKGYIVTPEEETLNSLTLKLYKKGNKTPVWERLVELSGPSYRFDYNDLILPDLESGIYQLKAVNGHSDLSELKNIYVAKDLNRAIDENLAVFLSHENRPVNSKSKLLLNVPQATPDAPITVLLSYEQAGLLDYDVVVAEHPLNVIEFNVQPNMSPGVYLSALTIGYEESGRLVELKKELRKLYQQRERLNEEDLTPSLEPGAQQALEAKRVKQEAMVTSLNAAIQTLEDERGKLRSGLEVKVNATQAYLPVDETRKELDVNLKLAPAGAKGKYKLNLQTSDESGLPSVASVTLMLRPKAYFFLSPMDYFLSLPPFNVSTHSNLFLNHSEQSLGAHLVQGFKNLINPFAPSADLIFEPLLQTDEAGNLSYEFEFPETSHSWELLAFANTQENQWGSARVDLPVVQDLSIRPILPAGLTEGDTTELKLEIQNASKQAVESVLSLETSALTFQSAVELPLTLDSGESKTLTWPIQVQGGETSPQLKVTFNAQTYTYPLSIHSASHPDALKEGVFAQLSFTSVGGNEPLTHFERGKTYEGHLILMPSQNSSALVQKNEAQEEVLEPLEIKAFLPAGLKIKAWLPPFNDPEWANQQQRLAELKGINWLNHPVGFFQKRQLNANQLQLSSLNLPAGVYQFDFQVQAVWPGRFKMPALLWGNEPVALEQEGAMIVN